MRPQKSYALGSYFLGQLIFQCSAAHDEKDVLKIVAFFLERADFSSSFESALGNNVLTQQKTMVFTNEGKTLKMSSKYSSSYFSHRINLVAKQAFK